MNYIITKTNYCAGSSIKPSWSVLLFSILCVSRCLFFNSLCKSLSFIVLFNFLISFLHSFFYCCFLVYWFFGSIIFFLFSFLFLGFLLLILLLGILWICISVSSCRLFLFSRFCLFLFISWSYTQIIQDIIKFVILLLFLLLLWNFNLGNFLFRFFLFFDWFGFLFLLFFFWTGIVFITLFLKVSYKLPSLYSYQ